MMTLNQKYNLFRNVRSSTSPISVFYDDGIAVFSRDTVDGTSVLSYSRQFNPASKNGTEYFLRVKRNDKLVAEYKNGIFARVIHTLLLSIKKQMNNGLVR